MPDEQKPPPDIVHTSVRVPRALLDELDALERPYRASMTRTEHIREAIIAYVETHRGDDADR